MQSFDRSVGSSVLHAIGMGDEDWNFDGEILCEAAHLCGDHGNRMYLEQPGLSHRSQIFWQIYSQVHHNFFIRGELIRRPFEVLRMDNLTDLWLQARSLCRLAGRARAGREDQASRNADLDT
jgi:hypothetical protein